MLFFFKFLIFSEKLYLAEEDHCTKAWDIQKFLSPSNINTTRSKFHSLDSVYLMFEVIFEEQNYQAAQVFGTD